MDSVLTSLNSALYQALLDDERVVLLGEDIIDPYGGAFKVTRGLSKAFPERVLTTPISEAGIVGLATGMALRGLRPVVEIMFGDFLTLTTDQLINHASKFRWMYNDQVRVPLVIRTPMGGRRGYGPTHSQSIEKLFLGAPGLRVLAPCQLGSPGDLLYQAVFDDNPILFIENKLLYQQHVQEINTDHEFDITEIRPVLSKKGVARNSYAPVYVSTIRGAPGAGLTLAAYGYMLELARKAAISLAYEHEIFVEIITPTQLAPFDLDEVLDSASRTHRLVALEEGTQDIGWGAEVLAQAAQALGSRLLVCDRIAALNLPVPASGPLEAAVLPDVEQIIGKCQKIVGRR